MMNWLLTLLAVATILTITVRNTPQGAVRADIVRVR